MANRTLPGIMDGFADILRLDRTPRSVERGWLALNAAPLADVARAMVAHRVAPILFVVLRDEGLANRERSSGLIRLMESHHALSARRLDAARRLLADCLRRLNDAGIRPLLMRGVRLAESLYPDPAARPFADLDFFVRPDEYPRAKEAFAAFPTVSEARDHCAFAARGKTDRDDYGIELHSWFDDPATKPFVTVEQYVDQRIGGSLKGRGRIADAYETRTPVATPYGDARLLNDAQTLWHLCRHFTKHWVTESASLLSLTDIALAVRKDADESEAAFSDARAFDLDEGNLLYPPLFLARRYLGAPVSDGTLRELERSLTSAVRSKVERGNALASLCEPDVLPIWRATRPLTRRQRMALVLTRLFPSKTLLEAKGFRCGGAGIASYGRWYRHLWNAHALPMLRNLIHR